MDWGLLLLTLAVGLLLAGFTYFGVFPPGSARQKLLDNFEVLYKVLESAKQAPIDQTLENLHSELKGFEIFRKCQRVRLFVDDELDPRSDDLKQKQLQSAQIQPIPNKLIVGYALVSEQSRDKAREVVAANPQKYRIGRFPKALTMALTIPLRNSISFMLLSYCWERILKTVIAEGLAKGKEEYYSIKLEMYSPISHKQQQIEAFHPLDHQKEILQVFLS